MKKAAKFMTDKLPYEVMAKRIMLKAKVITYVFLFPYRKNASTKGAGDNRERGPNVLSSIEIATKNNSFPKLESYCK